MNTKRTILIVLPIAPFPPNDGGRISIYSFIDGLRFQFDFTLLVPLYNKESSFEVDKQRELWNNVTIHGVKLYNSYKQSRSRRVKILILKLKDKLLKFLGISNKKNVNEFDRIANTNVLIKREYIKALNDLLKTFHFDIIQVEYFNNLPLVNFLPAGSKKVYVEIESRNLILEDHLNINGLQKDAFSKLVKEHLKTIEIALMSKYDYILALSSDDEKRLKKYLPSINVVYSPYGLFEQKIKVIEKDKFKIEKLVFIGPEHHFPNKDGIEWFIDEAYESLIQLNVDLHIIGNWSERFIKKYHGFSRLKFPGFVENLEVYIENSALIVPIRIGGGGLRAKNLVSLASGIPIISTKLGYYGYNLQNKKEVLMAETPLEMVEAFTSLINDLDYAFNIAKMAQEYYLLNHSPEVALSIRKTFYESI